MTKLVLILLPAGVLLATPTEAETLTGMVLSTEDAQFVFRQTSKQTAETEPVDIRVVFLPATQRGRFARGPAFPRCVRPGRTLRISGSFDSEKNIFVAREIHGIPGPGRHHDPTGVRARLGRCRQFSASP
ncbi:MAG TPA: hypothetical protein ENI88_04495 [Desulfobulbus sp.]|nr:hypothetical protein [Desulfobulbus sp.]